MRTVTAAAVIAALFAGACSSNYFPRTRGRVAVMLRGGQPVYVRDNQVYSHGLLGGGLRDAVAGNPDAERAADEYSSRLKTGLLVGLGGLACSTVAMVVALKDLDDGYDEYGERDSPPAAAWVALGCMVASIGGIGYLVTAEPYRWDAINIFNDGVDAAPPPAPPVQGPPGGWVSMRKPKITLTVED
jgi:hypothetical protein